MNVLIGIYRYILSSLIKEVSVVKKPILHQFYHNHNPNQSFWKKQPTDSKS
jgi:hypothetical protein